MSNDNYSITITLDLTGTILGPDIRYSQDTVHIMLDSVALNGITEELQRILTEANLIWGNAGVYLAAEDVIVHVYPTPGTKISHEVLKSLKPGDHVRRPSTLHVWYKFREGNVEIVLIELDEEGVTDG
ncbi:hypothetical protein BDW72DRAFT_197581 [Aspergillus terricola var. indicus]